MLTTAEAAERLGFKSKRSISLLCRQGIIKGEKRGRDWFVSEDEIERYRKERRPAHRPKGEAGTQKGS